MKKHSNSLIIFAGGFSLVEMAVVLVIVGLLLGSLVLPFTAQLEQQRRSETKKIMDDAKDALVGYALINNYLPCPDRQSGGGGGINDTANDGIEDFSTGTGICAVPYGNLPWSTLSLMDRDAWGSRIIYRVTTTFSNRSPAANFSISTPGDLRVCSDSLCGSVLTSTAAAVLFSLGPNGGICSLGACVDELENTDADMVFVNHLPTVNGANGTEYFDDMVNWISAPVLISKMVSAGKLP